MERRARGKILLWADICDRLHDVLLGDSVLENFKFEVLNGFPQINQRTLITLSPMPRLFFCDAAGFLHNLLIYDQKHLLKVFLETLLHEHCRYLVLTFSPRNNMDPINTIDDPRVSHCYANLNSSNYRTAARYSTR